MVTSPPRPDHHLPPKWPAGLEFGFMNFFGNSCLFDFVITGPFETKHEPFITSDRNTNATKHSLYFVEVPHGLLSVKGITHFDLF